MRAPDNRSHVFFPENQVVPFSPFCPLTYLDAVLTGMNTPARAEVDRDRTMKMYILVKETVPIGFAMVAAAHAPLAAYLKFRDSEEIGQWLSGPFYKTVCRVTASEFEQAKTVCDHVVITESGLGGEEVALAFRPREDWPKPFRYYRLYK